MEDTWIFCGNSWYSVGSNVNNQPAFTLADSRCRSIEPVTCLLESATESLKELKTKPDASSLVPVGLGTFVKSKISSNDKVVLNIGAGVAVEKDTDSAINYLEARIKEIEVALQDASAKKRDAESRLEHGKQQINQMMQSSRSPPQ